MEVNHQQSADCWEITRKRYICRFLEDWKEHKRQIKKCMTSCNINKTSCNVMKTSYKVNKTYWNVMKTSCNVNKTLLRCNEYITKRAWYSHEQRNHPHSLSTPTEWENWIAPWRRGNYRVDEEWKSGNARQVGNMAGRPSINLMSERISSTWDNRLWTNMTNVKRREV